MILIKKEINYILFSNELLEEILMNKLHLKKNKLNLEIAFLPFHNIFQIEFRGRLIEII